MRALAAALVAAGLLAAAPAGAAEDRPSATELLDEAAKKALEAIKMMLKAIPQYSAPEINENGDIIIRRKRPEPEAPKPDAPSEPPGKPIQTQT